MTRRPHAPPSRRDFLRTVTAGAAAAPWVAAAGGARPAPAAEPLRLLVLGGTSFLGPAVVDYALARGHKVALFNRGRTHPEMYPQLEQLRGDRNTGDLASLEGREFDAVIDNSGYVPAHVAATAGLFAGVARHYTMVSSISVYPAFGQQAGEIDEDAEVATVADDVVAQVKTIRESMPHYGAMKALCEQAAEKAMPGRVHQVRPGLIVGPGDPTDRFTWWPVRVDRGGAVLAPGDQDAAVQVIDVRDLGAWMVRSIEDGVVGVHNAVGFDGRVSMAEFLGGCKCATAAAAELVWASEEFLAENQVGPWMEMPLWIPRAGRTYARNDRARAQGLTFRPLADTIRDTLHWARTERGDRPFTRTGVRPEREKELVAKLRR